MKFIDCTPILFCILGSAVSVGAFSCNNGKGKCYSTHLTWKKIVKHLLFFLSECSTADQILFAPDEGPMKASHWYILNVNDICECQEKCQEIPDCVTFWHETASKLCYFHNDQAQFVQHFTSEPGRNIGGHRYCGNSQVCFEMETMKTISGRETHSVSY